MSDRDEPVGDGVRDLTAEAREDTADRPTGTTATDRVDPVEAAHEGTDLQGVATWEERSALDRGAVAVYGVVRRAGRWLPVVLGLGLFLAQIAMTGFLVVREPFVGALAALSIVPAVGLVAYIWYVDPTLREPLRPLAATFALAFLLASLAAVVNTVASIPFEAIPVAGLALYYFLVVGPAEEAVKLLAVRTHAYRGPSFDAVVDGAVYGAVAGLGFAAIENLAYITQGYVRAASIEGVGQLTLASGTAVVRAFVGPGHVIWSAFAGYYLGLAKFNPARAGPIVVKGLLVAALIHATYNTLVTYLPLTGLTFVAFVIAYDGLFAVVLVRRIRRYGSLYGEAAGGDAVGPAG